MTENISTLGKFFIITTAEPAKALIPRAGVDSNVFLGILISACVYLLVALLYHGVTEAGKNRRYKNALWMLCSFNYCFSILHNIATIIIYNGVISSTHSCNVVRNFAVYIFYMLNCTIYCFLWIRQYVAVKNMSFRDELEKIVMMSLEYITMGLLMGNYIALTVISIIHRRFTFDQEQRECRNDMDYFIEKISYTVWGIIMTAIHVALMVMLAYPLANSLRFRKTAAQQSTSATNMYRLIRRCLLTTILFISSDILVAALFYSKLLEGKVLLQCVYNANALFNSFALTMTFNEWRVMCFPWRRDSRKEAR